MAGYDPQKARGRHEIPDDEPAPVDGLLGPVPEADSDGPTLAHDAGRPMVRQVLPVPPAVPADEPEATIVAPTTDEPGSQPELVPDAEPVLDAAPEPGVASPPVPTQSGSGGGATTPLTAATPSTSSRARIAAIVAAVLAVVLLVLWRRRHRA